MIVNRLAWLALIALIFLVFAGAIVRVTGSGLGCPDWPTCWGCLIPPTSVEQIDVDKLDLEKFKKHAARKGMDPDKITRETVLDSFDPVHTWIEYSNRLATMPLGLATLLLTIFSFRSRQHKKWIISLSVFCLLDVIVNAVMGAIVVRSGLKPGIITTHMALALLLIVVLVTVIWLSRPDRKQVEMAANLRRRLLLVSALFFACLFCEGILGSQLREQTDEMLMSSETEQEIKRDEWHEKLEPTLIFKVHRSFSWTLLITSVLLFFWSRKLDAFSSREPLIILLMVIAMMIMGIVLGHLKIYATVQVLHVGLTAILLAFTWHWLLKLWSTQNAVD